MQFAKIIVDISHEKVDRPFTYKIPEILTDAVKPGVCVNIPFGAGNTLRQGYVLELADHPGFAPEKCKEIHSVAQKQATVESNQIRLAAWMRQTYGCTMIMALKTVLPARQKTKEIQERTIRRLVTPKQAQSLYGEYERKHQTAKARLVRELEENETLPYTWVTGQLQISLPTIRSLEKEQVLQVEVTNRFRNPVDAMHTLPTERKALSMAQQQIVDKVLADFDGGHPDTYLIHGITGSGKTEVYMGLIEEILKRGKQAIVLIPEIALTYQTLSRFYSRFGDRVSVMNSTLSAGEKYDQCERARRGEVDVIIGPRSALFTPFPNLGLIIMDEEHESSYKSETMPRYHARETAVELARMCGASVVLGSATPSLESYYRAKNGTYQLFTLKERLTGGTLPTVQIVDLREELREGNRSIFSRQLQQLMEDRLKKKEQMMLFLNRRGYAGFISCRSCGLVLKCPHCDVSLSEHRGGILKCHYCGYEQPAVKKCPQCGSPYIAGFKAGTQQIEEQLKIRYPGARILRMDADTTRTKESYEKILSAFARQEADILLGTQMIVKGHDFPKVTLVGVLAADMSLFAADYRAGERTFQLLTQAAGRAGRGELPGEVIIQTYQPEHYSIVHAANQDYEGFYEEEILYRDLMMYPPVAHLMAVMVADRNEKSGKESAETLAALVKNRFSGHNMILVGPSEAAIGKVNDVYRFVFYIKSRKTETLAQIREQIESWQEANPSQNRTIQFDLDPMHVY